MFEYTIDCLKRGIKKSYCSYRYTPTDAIIFLTYRCTSQCKACNIWQRPVNIDDELTWSDWEPILKNLAENKIESVELFGGDALLRKDLLVNMIDFCTQHDIETYFPTNSSSLQKETVKKLVDAGLGTIYFSLDEVPDIGESVRGIKRHFDRTIKSINSFIQARGPNGKLIVSCITTVSSLNFKHLEALVEFAHKAGADEYLIRGISEFTTDAVSRSEVHGIKPEPYFMPTDNKSHAYTTNQAKKLLDTLQSIKKNRKKYSGMNISMENMDTVTADNLTTLTYPRQTCLFATTQVVISPYGNVLPCLYYKDYHLGNIKKQNLTAIWGNSEHRAFCVEQKNNRIPLCDHCSIKYYHKSLLPTIRDLTHDAFIKISGHLTQN